MAERPVQRQGAQRASAQSTEAQRAAAQRPATQGAGSGKSPLTSQNVAQAQQVINAIIRNVETVIVGKTETVRLCVLSLIMGGHVLLEDVPGVGKTSLASALAKSVSCSFRRIQFTPDIMPSDVTGFSMFNQKTNDFEFRPGAVMANFVLADEINRASAKTQSALLEAMEERQVTVDSKTYRLEEPFMVMATQNPLESFGTYPLPEAQIDRFLMKLSMGYPALTEEVQIALNVENAKAAIQPVVNKQTVLSLRTMAKAVRVDPDVAMYAVEIVNATRSHPDLKLGSSPRGSLSLLNLARVFALSQGRAYVTPDMVKYLVPFVLGHRVQRTRDAIVAGRSERAILDSIVANIAVPV